MSRTYGALVAILLLVECHLLPAICSAQILETETARPLNKGFWELCSAYEHQFSSEGSEAAAPIAAEYGLTNRLGLLVEPVLFTAIDPADSKPGKHATGIGDLEMTLSYLARGEGERAPAFAFAGEVKLPTARNNLIGTRHTDFAGYAIASKRFGNFDTHANVSYTIIGQPAGVHLDNVFGFALAGVYHGNSSLSYFGEVFGNTASSPESETSSMTPGANPVVREATGAELVGTLGISKSVRQDMLLSFGVSYDNNNAILLRPGVVLKFR